MSSTDERGFVTTYGYDGAGRMTTVTDALGHTTTSVFDAAGRTVSRIDALGHATSWVFDAAGRTSSMTDATGAATTYEYDAAGMKSAEVDALGRRQEWAYDDLGRLVEAKDQGGNAWVYGYDAVGNHVTQTDALGRVTRFEYDEQKRQTARVLPMGQRETFAYDVAGNRVKKTDFNGFTTTYQYDLLGRKVAAVPDPAKGEATATWSYTPTGRKAQTANGSGVVRYSYDERERMIEKAVPAGKLKYTYDASGHVATMKSSNVGGVDVTYGWDGAGRLVSVGDPVGVSTFEYDAAGRMTKRVDPNGVEMTYAYDSANRVLDVIAKRGGTAFADYAYQRDVIGRVTNLTELSGRVVTYGYSTAGRLLNETISGEPHGINGAISYTHDAVGNRLTRTSTLGPVNGQTFVYDANDRIAAEMYDANGNVLASEGDVFQYDFEDRLTAINGGVSISYDAGGNIGSRTEGGTKVSYLVDEMSPTGYTQVVEEVTAGMVGKTFTYGLVALRTGGKTYVLDGHTDVRALASSSGIVTDEYDYEAFGSGTRMSETSSNPLRYAGERSESAGLTFLRARHMRSGSGRFLGMDAAPGSRRATQTLHRIVYANGDPVRYVDPTGYQASTVNVLAAGLALGIGATLASVSYSMYMNHAKAGVGVSSFLGSLSEMSLWFALPTTAVTTVLAAGYSEDTKKKTKAKTKDTSYPPGTKSCPRHHIVPQKAAPYADPARKLLAAQGISIHSWPNLVQIDLGLHEFIHEVWQNFSPPFDYGTQVSAFLIMGRDPGSISWGDTWARLIAARAVFSLTAVGCAGDSSDEDEFDQ